MSRRFFRIHPGIGVARVGDSPSEFFIGPERPGEPPNFDLDQNKFRPFKDSQGRIKRQAARFRIFEYELKGEKIVPIREVSAGQDGVLGITWKVHMANRKAAFFKFDGQDGADGRWSGVRNANIRGSYREKLLVIDPGVKAVSGRNHASVPLTNPNRGIPIKSLGELRTDEKGNLLVLGGSGESNRTGHGKLIDDYVNNDQWFDDMSDGPVSAEITYTEDGATRTATLEGATGGWVLVGPPDYAPSVGNVVRLFDTLWDVAVRFKDEVPLFDTDGLFDQGLLARLAAQRKDWNPETNTFSTYRPSFLHEIYPLLDRALLQRQVHNPEASKSYHASFAGMEQELGTVASSRGRRLRRSIFGYMRNPSGNDGSEPLLMPKGLGDNYSDTEGPRENYFMSLTRVQFALLERWAHGEFEEDWDEAAARAIPREITAEGLERASVENSVGGPFFPGIDCSWMVRRPELYAAPFRVKHSGVAFPDTARLPIGPGFFSQQMALPWQADFFQCKKQFFPPEHVKYDGDGMYHMWWCAHRPDDVYANKGDFQMVSWTRELEKVAELDSQSPEIKASASEDTSAFEIAMYIQMQQNWPRLGFVINEGDTHFETEARSGGGTTNPSPAPAPCWTSGGSKGSGGY